MASGKKCSKQRRNVLSLEDACLSVIIADFGGYCAAYKKSNTKVAIQHLEFLARRFSSIIFCRLKDECKLETQHLDFLVNPYLKELDLYGINVDLLPYLIDKLQSFENNVLTLETAPEIEQDLLECLISSLPSVEAITLDGLIYPEICKFIAKRCPSLKVLKFDESFYDHDELLENSIMLNFTDDLSRLNISSVLKHCPKLEIFDYPDTIGLLYEMRDIDVHHVKTQNMNILQKFKKYALKTLSSKERKYNLSDALEMCAVICPHASSLRIDHLENNEELNGCSLFSHLEVVRFERISSITSLCFDQFLSLKGVQLVSLDVPYVSCISIVTLMESCTKLQSLKLRQVRYYKFDQNRKLLSFEAKLPDLKTLKFAEGDFAIQGAVDTLKLILQAAKNVKKLGLTGCSGLSNEFISSLSLYGIRELNASKSDICAYPLKKLILHGNLRKLKIVDCFSIRVTSDDYCNLSQCGSDDGESNDVDIRCYSTIWSHRLHMSMPM